MHRLSLIALALCATPLAAQQAADAIAPEAAGAGDSFAGLSDAARASLATKAAGKPVIAQDWMIAAANPLAVQAGADVLAAGGTAADAMVATQAVLGLVIGGDQTTGEAILVDGGSHLNASGVRR